MTARAEMDAMVTDAVGPVLLAAGYTGSPPTWHRATRSGDRAVVTVLRSGPEDAARCALEIAVVPAPWLEFMTEWLGAPPVRITETLGLYRARLGPSGTPDNGEHWWQARNAEEVRACGADLVTRLQHDVFPVLNRLLNPECLLASVRDGDLGMLAGPDFASVFAFAEAVLLSEDGPSERIELLLTRARDTAAPDRREAAEQYAAWVRARAVRHG